MKIIALMPTQKVIQVEAVQSLVAFQAGIYNKEDNVRICFANGHNPVKARHSLAKYAVTQETGDYVIWLDSDHIYEPDKFYTLVEKIEKNGLDMLSAAYRVRGDGKVLAHGSYEYGKFRKHDLNEVKGIVDCDVLGFGFLVMKWDFLKKMFESFPNDLFNMDLMDNSTEDVYFCTKCKEVGVRVCYDSDTVIGHLTTMVNR